MPREEKKVQKEKPQAEQLIASPRNVKGYQVVSSEGDDEEVDPIGLGSPRGNVE